jgi:hypothetical protein
MKGRHRAAPELSSKVRCRIMQQSHKPIPSVLASLAVTLAEIGTGLHSACAQDAATQGGMQILVTRYLWLSGINTTIKTPLHRRCGRPGPGTAGNAGKFRNLVVDGCRLLCRFSDAGNDEPLTRSGGRRLKSAKARNRVGRGTVGATGYMGI